MSDNIDRALIAAALTAALAVGLVVVASRFASGWEPTPPRSAPKLP